MAASITVRLGEIEEQIDDTAALLEGDTSSSSAFRAVFDELHRKTREARDTLKAADEYKIREHIAEVEEAADCAKRAAEADENLPEKTREAVLDIHDALSELKDELGD